jgi:hypothetical protein
MTTLAVLIGGPCDGRRVAVHDGVKYLLSHAPRPTEALSYTEAVQPANAVSHNTRYREFWGAPGLSCMCPEGMTQAAAMKALIEGYRHEIQGS